MRWAALALALMTPACIPEVPEGEPTEDRMVACSILLVGDSITVGQNGTPLLRGYRGVFGDLMTASGDITHTFLGLQGVDPYKYLAYNGATIGQFDFGGAHDIAEALGPSGANLTPTHIYINLGTNNIGTTDNALILAYESLLNYIHSLIGSAVIVVEGLTYTGLASASAPARNAQILTMNGTRFPQMVADRITAWGPGTCYSNIGGWDVYGADGPGFFHPDASGYTVMGQQVYSNTRNMFGFPAVPDGIASATVLGDPILQGLAWGPQYFQPRDM